MALVVLLGLAAPARAEPASPVEQAAAGALFDEAMALFEGGKPAEALPKFEASLRMDPSVGAWLNIARCHEKLGHVASAFGAYDAAEALARVKNDESRRDLAAEKKRELEPRLSRLRIDVDPKTQATEIRLDGKALPPGATGTAIPIDAGDHVLEADRKGAPLFRATVPIGGPGTKTVLVPAPPAKVPPPPPPFWNGRRTAGVALGGFGVASVVVGAIFGVRAGDAVDASQAHCIDWNPDPCDAEGVALRDRANQEAWVSNIGIGLGAAALVGGVISFVLGSTGSKNQTAHGIEVGPRVGAGGLEGLHARWRF